MAEARLCSACAAWLCSADDAWCGRCGEPCAQLSLTLGSDVLQIGQVAPDIPMRVTNSSCAPLAVREIDLPSWLTLTEPLPTPLRAGQTVLVKAKARTVGMKSAEAATLSVVTPAGRATALLMVIEENPELVCDPPELELWDARPGSATRRTHAVRIVPVNGFLRIREIRPGPVGGLTILSDLPDSLLASPAHGAPVVVEANVERFRNLSTASLLVRYDGPNGIRGIEVPLRVAVRKPPRIRWAAEHAPPEERLQTGKQTMKFVLMNQADANDGGTGNATLTIEEATLTPPPECSGAAVRLLTRLPAKLRGGDALTIEFDLGIENVRPPQQRDAVHFMLKVRTNGPELEKPVGLFIRPMPEFDGVLAIDFGSSNTCCAVVETGREYERLPLDGDRVVSPTVLRYLDLSTALPQTETGARVKNNAATSEQVAASIVDRLKQRLGDDLQDIPVRPSNSTLWLSRTATEAATDYLRLVRQVAEREKGTLFQEFILTHPAVCSLRQYRNLTTALQRAFGDRAGRVHFLQEPIAALIPFLAKQAGVPGLLGYTVASFDLGGGTTDLALVRVEHRVQPTGRVDIHPSILSCRGVRFGGEDLTAFLEKHLTAHCNLLLEEQRPGAKLIAKDLPGASMDDILRNRFALREAAEQFKVSLSKKAGKPGEQFKAGLSEMAGEPVSVILRIQPAPGEAAQDFTPPFAELLRRPKGVDVKQMFLDEVARKVAEIAQLLRASVDESGSVDVIQLSGMTASLPIVGEVLRGIFPGVRQEPADNFKECVVMGACLSRSMRYGTQRRLVLPPGGTQRTTSSIGTFDADTRTFTTILRTDAVIPAEGLVGELPGAWFGAERVALFENLGVTADELRSASDSKLLSKLGTWKPERVVIEAEDAPWTLHLRLKDFTLEVTALGPGGETVRFRNLDEGAA